MCIHTTNDNKCETVYLSCSVSWGERPVVWVHCCVEEIQGCRFDVTQGLTNSLTLISTCIHVNISCSDDHVVKLCKYI